MLNLFLVSNTAVTVGYIAEIILAVSFIFAIIILSVQNKKLKDAERQSKTDAIAESTDEPAAERLAENSYAEEETAAAVSSEQVLDGEPEEQAAEIYTDDGAENDEPADEPMFAEIAASEPPSLDTYRLAKSFAAKLILSDDIVKERYSELKNALLSYRKVKARTSWKCETYRFGRVALAKIMIRGKKLCLYLALSPEDIPNEKYKVENVGGHKSTSETPTVYKVKSALRVKNAKQLIAILAEKHGLTAVEREPENFAPAQMTEEELLAKGLIRQVKSTPFFRK